MAKNYSNYTIKILGKTVQVFFCDDEENFEMENRYGFADIFKGKIVLNTQLSEDVMLHTLLHEIMHFWNEDLGLELNADDEEAHNNIDRIVTAFLILCKENGIDIKSGLLKFKDNKKEGQKSKKA